MSSPPTPSASATPKRLAPGRSGPILGRWALALLLLAGAAGAAQAGVRFENCSTGADGSISCDTVPTGNTLLNDEAARYGLFQNASPGWSEFDPYEGYNEDFGGGSF